VHLRSPGISISTSFGLGEPDCDVLDGSDVRLLRCARVLDEHLDGRDYVALDRLTIADFQLASMACELIDSLRRPPVRPSREGLGGRKEGYQHH